MVSKGKSIPGLAREVFKTRGFNGFYTGWSPAFLKSYPAWFSYFYSYDLSKKIIKTEDLSILQTALAATTSAIPITFITTPPDVIKSVLQANVIKLPKGKHSFILTGVNIIRSEGIHKLWRGFGFRLVHKMMNLFVGFTVRNQYDKYTKSIVNS